jgi:hypothetical protein
MPRGSQAYGPVARLQREGFHHIGHPRCRADLKWRTLIGGLPFRSVCQLPGILISRVAAAPSRSFCTRRITGTQMRPAHNRLAHHQLPKRDRPLHLCTHMLRRQLGLLRPVGLVLGGFEQSEQASPIAMLRDVLVERGKQVRVADSEQRELRDAIERRRRQSGVLAPVLDVGLETEDIDEALDLARIRGELAGELAQRPADLWVVLTKPLRELLPAHLSDRGLLPCRQRCCLRRANGSAGALTRAPACPAVAVSRPGRRPSVRFRAAGPAGDDAAFGGHRPGRAA